MNKIYFLALLILMTGGLALNGQAVQQFYHNRIENAIDEISSTEVNSGAVVWKLYNHTYIIKTPSVTIGFDIQRGIPGNENFAFSRKITDRLIIPGHENELNHSTDHREPCWLNYTRPGNDPALPWIQMAPGEKYHYYSRMQ